MIFDLHNDLLTAASLLTDGNNILAENKHGKKKLAFDKNTVYAIWTSELKNSAAFIKNVIQAGIRLAAVEDLGFIPNCENGWGLLNQLKPVYASLTWNGENAFAGGAHSDVGLSESGRKMIDFLESNGILLDTAHLSRRAFSEAAEVAKKPFICSHTCFDGVYEHRRNLTDGQVKTLVAKDGLIGLCLVSEFMGKPQAAADDVVKQIDYFVQKFGDKNLAIGTDFNGCKNPAVKNKAGFKRVAEDLLKIGYTQKTVDKIFYINAHDFLTERGSI